MPRERTGSVKRDPKRGDFVVRVTYHDEQGKRCDLRRRKETASEANRELRRLMRSLDDHGGTIVDGARMIFNELADNYASRKLIAPVYKGETRIAGLRSYKSQLAYLKSLRAFFGKQRIQSITHTDLEAYRVARLQTKTVRGEERGITSVNRELTLLRSVLNFAQRNGWLTRNPFGMGESLISTADEKHRDRILTDAEETRLLAACEARREHLRPLIIGAIDTAMRHGELLQLKWSDIDLDANLIRVRKTTTKTWESRTIGMTTRLRAELVRLWERSPANLNERVFGIVSNVKRGFTTARKLAQIDDLHFHDLRHTGTTRMIRAGMPPMEVMKITGHKQMATFLRYLNTDHQTARRAAEALDLLYAPKLEEVAAVTAYIN